MTKCLFSTVLGQGIKYFIFLWQRLGVVVVISRHKSTGMEKRTACVCVLSLEGERGEGGASLHTALIQITRGTSIIDREEYSLEWLAKKTHNTGPQKAIPIDKNNKNN